MEIRVWHYAQQERGWWRTSWRVMQYNLAGFGEVDRNNRGGSILVGVVRTILTYLADGNRDPYRSLQLAPYDWGVQKRKGPVQITDKCMVPGTIPRYNCHVAHC